MQSNIFGITQVLCLKNSVIVPVTKKKVIFFLEAQRQELHAICLFSSWLKSFLVRIKEYVIEGDYL